MPKKLKVANAILCDFVGQGFANKHILVNVISGDVRVQTFPAVVAFGLFVEVALNGDRPSSLAFEMQLNGDNLLRGGGALEEGDGSPDSPAVFSIPHFEFRLEEEAVLELYVSAPGFARTLAMHKRIWRSPTFPTV